MSVTTAIAIYFILWWVVLFTVLPWGVRSQHESEEPMAPGTDPGAPVRHRIGRTLVWTTIVTTAVFGAVWIVLASGLIPIDLLTESPSRRY